MSMRFEWDPEKDRANRRKHGLSFTQASRLFIESDDFLEIFDEAHSSEEDRFIAIGAIQEGVALVVYTERLDDVIRIISARRATTQEELLLRTHLRGEHGRRNP
jgi:uncharacterized DUF497 family protein